MKKELRKDLINLLILVGIFFIFYFILTRFNYYYGSTKDWGQQHYLIPEYFRNLFYETYDLFPDFAFNLGSGQNIYNFSYYGFLNPIILFSYLLPFVSMRTYIIVSTIFMLILSVILMYFFIKKKTNSNIAFICSFFFLMASPLIYHSHRHIMFINYMPFLILGYYGVLKYFENNNGWLLTLSVFLMIMTSYFFSVSGIFSIIFYGIYCYIKRNKNIKLKSFIVDGINFLIPILIGVLMSCILIVPTFYSLINGRSGTDGINIFKLFVPRFNVKDFLYSTYSCGLSSIALFSLIDNLFNKRENHFLSISLFIVLMFPIILYLLNGCLYIDSKVLITFLPLFIILISNTLNNIINNNVNYRKLALLSIFVCCLGLFRNFNLVAVLVEFPVMLVTIYLVKQKNSYKYFYYMLFPVIFIVSICFNLGDELVKRNAIDINNDLVSKILDLDDSYYKIGVYDRDMDSINNIYNLDYYNAIVYSSSSSMAFKDFYYNRIGNEIIFRSYGQMATTNNIFYNMYVGNKYIVSESFDSGFYEEIEDNIYKNENILPLGYSSNRLMNLDYYNSLSYPENIYAYMNYIIVDDNDIDNEEIAVFDEIALNYEVISSDVVVNKRNNGLYINSLDKSKVKLKINNDLSEKVLLISFDMNYQELCEVGDTYISINGVKNKLSCDRWKYNNNNYIFEYVLSDKNLSNLDIILSKGEFLISNIKFYTIDYSLVNDIVDDIDNFVVDMKKTCGDKIYGTIDVSESGYFNLSIPYDKGFNIYVDGEKVAYEKVDVDFIGFKIESGIHEIMIEYKSPFKDIGVILSIIGFVLFMGGFYGNSYRINRRNS